RSDFSSFPTRRSSDLNDSGHPERMRRGAIHEIRLLAAQTSAPRRRSWISRHPVFVGALVGFGAGFLIGYLPGDDGVFDDFTAGLDRKSTRLNSSHVSI